MSTTDSDAGASGPATIEEIQESLRQTAVLMAEMRAELRERDERDRRQAKERDERARRQAKERDERARRQAKEREEEARRRAREREEEERRRAREREERARERDRRAREWDERVREWEEEDIERHRRVMQENEKAKALREETALQMKETDRRLKKAEAMFTSQWGKLMESLVNGDLVPLLNERGIEVDTTHQRRRGRRNGEHFEIDIVAVNGREVVVVEVKTTLRSEDVTEFLAKLPEFPDFCKEYRGRRLLGAVAYLDSDASVTRYAERQGLFVIRATGSSASILNPLDFEPRVFG